MPLAMSLDWREASSLMASATPLTRRRWSAHYRGNFSSECGLYTDYELSRMNLHRVYYFQITLFEEGITTNCRFNPR